MSTLTEKLSNSKNVFVSLNKNNPTVVLMTVQSLSTLNTQLEKEELINHQNSINKIPRPPATNPPKYTKLKFGDYVLGLKVVPAHNNSKDLRLE